MAAATSLPLQHPPPLLGALRSRRLSGGARSPAQQEVCEVGCGESAKQKRENEGEHAGHPCVRSALRHRLAQGITSQKGCGPEDVFAIA